MQPLRSRPETKPQLVVEPLVRPVGQNLVGPALYVIPAARGGPHRTQGETALVVGIDQLVLDGRLVHQDAQPAERINALEHRQHLRWDRLARGTVEPVAPSDEVTGQFVRLTLHRVADPRRRARHIVQGHILRLVDRYRPRAFAQAHQVAGDLRLPIDHHAPPG